MNPSVVYVRTDRLERRSPRLRGLPPGFEDFFRDNGSTEPRRVEGAGSGFIVSDDGYILTNNHVVEGAATVRVQLIDNRVFEARIVGRDPNTDVAVIKIDASRLPAMAFGNSDQVRIGDWVLAVGNPLGFSFTVTAGIVSAKGRALRGLVEDRRYAIQDFIQTDAAINPGNSGGPLLDLQGRVVGINSAIASQTGLYSGYGFAIPINLARQVMDGLITRGRVDRAILGIGIDEVSPEDAEYVGLQVIRGVVIRSFPGDDSPASRAGLRLGDVIVALNDTAVTHMAQLQTVVGFKHPGETVRVTVMRREGDRTGIRRTIEVRLQPAPAEQQAAVQNTSDDEPKPAATAGKLGVQVQALPAEWQQRARLSEDQVGVVVTDIEAGGPSYNRLIGANQGAAPDIILFVDRRRVRNVAEFQDAVRQVRPGAVVELTVRNLTRDADQRIVRIRARR